ncbi:serine/threonine-protein kinase [Alienimonas californiensis]|uniref:Serine/threonine-protein kinase PknB n=1 Tax=Alienimonas californiensis TaxID=2527989 RepID=A0A517P5Y2_9PLAN|nr:serine/threonine-protein kinase [Alienimonas californiensis]QDT14790.1 Serine/threonine-protein kinase PknB [Alienimonas californiensis]
MADVPPATPPPDPAGPPDALGLPAAVGSSRTAPTSADKTVGPAGITRSGGARSGAGAGTVPAGRFLGRFRIDGTLGYGGMGTVYRAFDPTLERHVALKVPRFDADDDPELLRQFLREARAAAAVRHPHLVEVYEAGTIDASGEGGRQCYLASALCDGPDLAKWLANRVEPVPPPLAAALLIPIAEAVHRCHLAGVIHRDLKPANVLLDAPDPRPAEAGELPFVPKVSDFGVARVLEESAAATRTSRAVGTPLYMAPEQAGERPEEIGPATDVWALGAMLYELLAGRPPFDGRTTLALLKQIDEEDPPPPRTVRPGLPSGLDAICMKCLRKRPGDRYAGAAALAADLIAWREGRAVTARRFCWRDRLLTWLRRPERLRDAGIVLIMWNAPFSAGMAVLALDTWLERVTALPKDDALLGEAIAGSAMSAAMTYVGARLLRGDRWAWWVGFVAALGVWLYACSGWIWGGGAGFSIYDRLPAAKYLVMLSVTAGMTLQLTAVAVAAGARAPGRRD